MISLGSARSPATPTTDWFAQVSISVKLTCPSVAPVIAIIVVRDGRSFVADDSRPAYVIVSHGCTAQNSLTLQEFIHGMLPPQYDGSSREGVPPRRVVDSLAIFEMRHPSGISPSSESWNRPGKRSSMLFGKLESRPSALARTGSKSTNHDLKSASVIASSVSLI